MFREARSFEVDVTSCTLLFGLVACRHRRERELVSTRRCSGASVNPTYVTPLAVKVCLFLCGLVFGLGLPLGAVFVTRPGGLLSLLFPDGGRDTLFGGAWFAAWDDLEEDEEEEKVVPAGPELLPAPKEENASDEKCWWSWH